MTDSNDTRIGVKKQAYKKEIVIGPNTIKFVTIAVFAVLALIYLTQSTSGANRGVEVNELNNKKAELQIQKERLEAVKYQESALTNTDEYYKPKELEPVSMIEHVDSSGRNMAKK